MPLRPGYYVRRAVRNMRQSPVLSLASVATIALALALLAFFAIAVLNVQQMTAAWGEQLGVVVYLDEDLPVEQRRAWTEDLKGFPEVDEVFYVSQDEALERFRQRLGQNADLLEGLGENVLPASFEIRLEPAHRSPARLTALVEKIRQDHRFTDLQYGREWIEKFEALLVVLKATTAGLGGFLVFAALVIVTNTIKLTLYARQDELEAMAMVGATSLFIKLPYLVEGALQGILGGCAALALSFLAFRVILEELLGTLLLVVGIDRIHFLPPAWQLSLVVGGSLLGVVGSLFALRKFVRFGAV